MMLKHVGSMMLVSAMGLLGGASASAKADAAREYTRLTSTCVVCQQIDDLLTKYSSSLTAREQLDITYEIADVLAKISLAGKNRLEQQRTIYFSLKGAAEVIDDDFDATTIVRLIDLRKQAPKAFDEVFWHFPVKTQKVMAQRMQDLRDRKVRPGITIPLVRELE